MYNYKNIKKPDFLNDAPVLEITGAATFEKSRNTEGQNDL